MKTHIEIEDGSDGYYGLDVKLTIDWDLTRVRPETAIKVVRETAEKFRQMLASDLGDL